MTDKQKQCGTEADWHDNFIGHTFDPEAFTTALASSELCAAELEAADATATCACTAEDAEKCLSVFCPRQTLEAMPFPIAMVIPPEASPGSVLFAHDLAQTMVDVGRGHDPYNYVGEDVVGLVIGAPC